MTETTPKKTLRQSFEELPLRVRDWLTSERVTYFIIEINNRLGVDGETIRVIPRLILRLIVHDLEPNAFIHELAEEMDLPFSSAKVLAQEIEEKILRPIEATLRLDVGVDIKLIYLTEEKTPSPILEVINEESRPAAPAAEKLIPAPEVAHPGEYSAPATPPQPAAPSVQSPVYSPSLPAEALAKTGATQQPETPRPPVNPPASFTMPRVEPLPRPVPSPVAPARPASPPQSAAPQPAYAPKPTNMPSDVNKTNIPFRFEPSRVPKFPPKP